MSKRHRSQYVELDKRLRRLERAVRRDMVSIARSQSEKAMRDHIQDKHAELQVVWRRDEIESTSA